MGKWIVNPNPLELAWAGGFFDGEGTFIYSGRSLNASLSQRDRRPLDRFHAAVLNLGRIRLDEKHKPNPIFVWYVSDWRGTQAVMALLWRFLSEPKREQAQRAMHKRAALVQLPRAPTFNAIPANQGGLQMWCSHGHTYAGKKSDGTQWCRVCAYRNRYDACPECGGRKYVKAPICRACSGKQRTGSECQQGHGPENWVWQHGRHRCQECRRQSSRRKYLSTTEAQGREAVARL